MPETAKMKINNFDRKVIHRILAESHETNFRIWEHTIELNQVEESLWHWPWTFLGYCGGFNTKTGRGESSRGELMHGSKTSASTETVYKAVWYEQLLQIDVLPPALPRWLYKAPLQGNGISNMLISFHFFFKSSYVSQVSSKLQRCWGNLPINLRGYYKQITCVLKIYKQWLFSSINKHPCK